MKADDLDMSVAILRDFGAERVWVFGSAIETPEDASDLDLACEGIPPEKFYRAAGRLMEILSIPVDLVDVAADTRLSRYIRSKGRVLYDAGRPERANRH